MTHLTTGMRLGAAAAEKLNLFRVRAGMPVDSHLPGSVRHGRIHGARCADTAWDASRTEQELERLACTHASASMLFTPRSM